MLNLSLTQVRFWGGEARYQSRAPTRIPHHPTPSPLSPTPASLGSSLPWGWEQRKRGREAPVKRHRREGVGK